MICERPGSRLGAGPCRIEHLGPTPLRSLGRVLRRSSGNEAGHYCTHTENEMSYEQYHKRLQEWGSCCDAVSGRNFDGRRRCDIMKLRVPTRHINVSAGPSKKNTRSEHPSWCTDEETRQAPLLKDVDL